MVTQPLLEPGDSIGDYVIESEIARGGMGVVYKAKTPLGDPCAVKTLLPKARIQGDLADRFRREVQLLSYIDHVHVVRFYDAGVVETPAGSMLWVALEFLAGRTLREIIAERGGKLRINKVVRWGRQIAQGVHEAHKLRVIHRDLKPENIAIVQGDVAKVFDFGIAKYRDWGVKATKAGMALGTVAYMSPEQITGSGQIEATCDIYALGLILYELFAGRHALLDPNEKLELQPMLMKVLTTEPPLLHDTIAGFPEELSRIIDKMLQKHPEQRFSTMEELNDALSGVLQRSMDEKRAAFLTPSDTPPVEGTPPGSIPPVSSDGRPSQAPHMTTGSTPTVRKKSKQDAAREDATSDTVAVPSSSIPPGDLAVVHQSIYGASVQDFDAPTGPLPHEQHAPQAGPGYNPQAAHHAPAPSTPPQQVGPSSHYNPNSANQPHSQQAHSQQAHSHQAHSHQAHSHQAHSHQAHSHQAHSHQAHSPASHVQLPTPLVTTGAASTVHTKRGVPLAAVLLIGLAGITAGASLVMFGSSSTTPAATTDSATTASAKEENTGAKTKAKPEEKATAPAQAETSTQAAATASPSAAATASASAANEKVKAPAPKPKATTTTVASPPKAATSPKKPSAYAPPKASPPRRPAKKKCKGGLIFCDKDGL